VIVSRFVSLVLLVTDPRMLWVWEPDTSDVIQAFCRLQIGESFFEAADVGFLGCGSSALCGCSVSLYWIL
jgi:hypothetical protein